MTNPVIEPGSRVRLSFSLCLADGTLVDSAAPEAPLVITIGSGELFDALEEFLLGLSAGARRRFEIPAEQAFGPARDDAVHTLPRSVFPPELAVEAGQVIGFAMPSGQETPGVVVAVAETEVTVDFSHPLAGHDLVFEVEILDVEPAA
ncbi:MAG: FKBP-type peptidyl-prolyl cis-trans isomerase [Gammaproteobacteria bacterium]|nr:FKBP-type peptidyl-prolyl cis-trans isomerase [Gammaproteobacteria bacterium]